ncbi:integrase [uncultured Mediterranean phage uvMED]|nr:integrase [uncultured Mediterranean phage uvMED]
MLKVTKRKDRNSYYVFLHQIGGKRKTFKSKIEAENYAQTKWEEHLKNQYIPVTVSGSKGIANWFDYQQNRYEQGEFLQQELRHKKNIADKFVNILVQGKTLGKWNLEQLVSHPRSPASISQEIISQILEMNIAHKTKKSLYYSFKNIFTFFHERKWTHENAIGSTLFPKNNHSVIDNKAKRITKENIEKIINFADPKYKLAIKFATYTGLRQGEQRELRWKDINFKDNIIIVSRGVQRFGTVGRTKTKNGQRIVPLVPSIAKELLELRMSIGRPDDEALVFGNSRGNYIHDRFLRRQLQKACMLAEVDHIRWHDLRHFYASILLQTYGDDLHKVTSFMGHGSIEMTRKVYGHWLDDKKRNEEDAAKLDAAFTL